MPFADLITLEQLTTACPDLDAEDLADAPGVIAAVSHAISRRYSRAMAPTTLREEFTVGIARTIRLRYKPVIAVGPVECDLAVCLSIGFALPPPARATVAVLTTGPAGDQTATALALSSTVRGVTAAPVPLALADHPTVGDLAAAVNALPGGLWTAAANTGQADRAAAELYAQAGTQSAVGTPADLWGYTRDLNNWTYDPLKGTITTFEWRAQAYQFPDAIWGVDPRLNRFRVTYTAGNTATPPEVARAAVQLARFTLERTQLGGAVRSRRTADYETVLASGAWPRETQTLLSPFRSIGFN